MTLSPDEIVYFSLGPLQVSATLVFTWVVMLVLVVVSYLVTRGLKVRSPLSRGQHLLEGVVAFLLDEIEGVTQHDARPYLPFVGTLFLFIVVSNLLVSGLLMLGWTAFAAPLMRDAAAVAGWWVACASPARRAWRA